MKTLAIDTSTRVGSIAVEGDEAPLAEISAGVSARHGEVLLPHIASALDLAKLTIGELDLIAVGIGPGSFTGLRVGVATAKGLAFARAIPIVGISSLEVLAAPFSATDLTVVPALDAFKGEVFVAAYRRGALVREPFHATPDRAFEEIAAIPGEMIVLGDGARTYAAHLAVLGARARVAPHALDFPRAFHLAQLAREAFLARGPSDLESLEPLYVRPSDAVLPARPLRID